MSSVESSSISRKRKGNSFHSDLERGRFSPPLQKTTGHVARLIDIAEADAARRRDRQSVGNLSAAGKRIHSVVREACFKA